MWGKGENKMTELTVYDLMGEDHEIEASLNAKDPKRVLVEITNEDGQCVYSEESHIYAWESLVLFAQQVLNCDKRIQEHLELLEQ